MFSIIFEWIWSYGDPAWHSKQLARDHPHSFHHMMQTSLPNRAFWGWLPSVIWPSPGLWRREENMHYPPLELTAVSDSGHEVQLLHLPARCISEAPACLLPPFETGKSMRIQLCFPTCVGLERWFALNTYAGWVRFFPQLKMAQCYFMAKGSISLNLLEAGGFQGPSFE